MKYIYRFEEGNKDMRGLLGGKGANLAQMTSLGFPVPSGFTISTEALAQLSNKVGKQFNSTENPLLVSVRSGAAISMPGMMDTILNIGLNDQTVKTLAAITDNERFAYDSYRRLLAMFGNVVYEIPEDIFDQILEDTKITNHYASDVDLTVENLHTIVGKFKELYIAQAGKEFPQDPKVQLLAAVNAVFESWNNHRAPGLSPRESYPQRFRDRR